VFGFPSTHQVLYDFKDVDRVLTKRHKNLDVFGTDWTLLVRVFDMSTNKTGAEMNDALEKMPLCTKPLYNRLNEYSSANKASTCPGKTIDLVIISTRKRQQAVGVVGRRPCRCPRHGRGEAAQLNA
jgi:hypothetical protein